ncbi:hypothetical protein CLV24_11597 [Pontibacter ummariensis]|uniref:Uncharacterized protein n=1 Tax=Pontibacter ummariensis TaxID=1610492 RepID=A0A239I208_9BACT|nr:DUF6544 family protein [Pontibacter ummariensis]PRY10180.1 hypothetical protein CLV24_11597 [Pontibacter ummariensis]SNS87559.1 hypothetical protein SAMN06296052_11597 [Pontibacter ummariensis]
MVRIVFSLLLVIHGLTHLLGFLNAWHLAAEDPINTDTLLRLQHAPLEVVGLAWGLSCVLFLAAALLFLLKKDWWWMMGLAAVLLSQLLIIACWADARYGTVANGIIMFSVLLAYGAWRFHRMVAAEVRAFYQPVPQKQEVLTEGMLLRLPPAVQKWLQRSSVVGQESIQAVQLKQTGEMRTKPNGAWMPVNAEQYVTVDTPGFLWVADVKAAPYLHLYGRDKYEEGRGHMLIKLLALFSVADAKGPETDQGSLLRYLAEMVWYPTAALCRYISWEGIDATTAKATMRYGAITAAGVFKFTEEGDVKSFQAQRYYSRKGGATLESWHVAIEGNSFRSFQGIRVPTRAAVTWQLLTGDFTWYRLQISDIAYNHRADASISREDKATPEAV